MKKPSKLSVTQRHNIKGLYFMIPFILGILFFYIEPIISSITFAFSKVTVDLDGYTSEFIGLENFKYAFTKDANYTTVLSRDLMNLLWKTPVIIILSLFLALLINKKFKGRLFVRAVFFLPVIFSNGVLLDVIQNDAVVQSAVSATSVLDSGVAVSQTQGLSELLTQAGFAEEIIQFTTMVTDSFFSLVWNSGVQMLIFLSGLQSISPSLYEAASVEGASGWETFCKITVPMLSPMILLNIIYTIVDSYASTSNGVIKLVINSISDNRFGNASAMAWTYFLVIGVIIGIVFFVSSRAGKPQKER